ncbi:ABC transporter ATP-binding protein [Streptomyces sp. I05A-00742]|uniref:ABC transporter ATP-binding protein n=1 Tax=Streptomyces sp. I05A-00742 TaxID=2732853 RepID=UPI001488CF1C|nr:ABC transporter ATP-binding protein [Streptomyces sp. I05A-00742]
MKTRESVIEVSRLRRRYGPAGGTGFEAVREIGFEVRRGEVFALLGAEGAGKTSTVELLAGLAPPTGGRVTVFGHDPYTGRKAVRPRIGVMPREDGLPSGLTAAETAAMWAGCTSGARPVDEALALVELVDRRDVRVERLSGGERRRLGLALALLGRPEVLLLDEPTAGLDPWARHTTWDLVRRLRAEGTTVVLTTRRPEEAEALADRLAILRGGRIVAEGAPSGVLAAYPSRIRFAMPPGWFVGDLPPLAALGVLDHRELPDGTGRVELSTRELQRTLTGLLLWAREQSVELEGLDARTASLEEAFPRIAGPGAAGSP